jgi:hypothetical protein
LRNAVPDGEEFFLFLPRGYPDVLYDQPTPQAFETATILQLRKVISFKASVASSRPPLSCSLGFFRKPRHAKTIEICR